MRHTLQTLLPCDFRFQLLTLLYFVHSPYEHSPRFNSQQVVFVAPCKGGKKETELYWRWVEEVKPPLPRDFRHKFHMTAILLKVGQKLWVSSQKQ